MSAKHHEIDLNADAVSGDRENEEHRSVIGVSVAETLTEPENGRVQRSEVDKVRVCDSAKVICDLNICGNVEENGDNTTSEEIDKNINGVGVDREVDVLGKVGNAEKRSEILDIGVDAKYEENNGGCGDVVSWRDENEVEGAAVADRASGVAEMDRDTNVGPVGEVFELEHGINDRDKFQLLDQKLEEVTCHGLENQAVEIDTQTKLEALEQGTDDRDQVQSSHQKLEEATSYGSENQAMEIDAQLQPEALEQGTDDREKLQSLHQKFKEAISDGLENQGVEVDIKTQLEGNEDQHMDVHVSKAGDSSNVLKESYVVNLVVDLDPYMTKDGDASGDVNAKLVSSKLEFCEGDLVWGKVRSHPWWPGQIFGPSAASKKAKKYFKKDSYLIAYFGDQTFAWNEASKLKSFWEHFAQMEKQTSLEDFHYAVDCALEEVSRRVEFGLACSCVHEKSYEMIKSQITVNAGIRKESSRRDGGDSYSNAAYFEPIKLSEHIKYLAQLPYNSEVDRLEFVTLKSQLSAFYRWKGYLQLPEFNVLGELLESDADIPLLREVMHEVEGTQSAAPDSNGDKHVSSATRKLKSQDGSSHKRKHTNGDSVHPRKKEKSLLDLLAGRHVNMSNGKRATDGKGDELISSSVKKGKSVDSISDDRAVKHKKLDSISDDMSVKHKKSGMLAVKNEKGDLSVDTANKCLPIKQTFGVGNSILKVASQLNGSSPISKFGDRTFQKTVVKNKSKEKSQSKRQFPSEEISPAGLLSQLNLTARDPMERWNFLISLVSFFSEFRNSVSLDQPQEEATGEKTAKTWTNLETTEASESEPMKDYYWTDRIIQSNPEEQQAVENKYGNGEVLQEAPSEKEIPPVEPTSDVQLSTLLDSGLQTAGENLEQKTVKPVDPLDGFSSYDLSSPTALILNFTDLDSVPSKENLNKIFSHYGPLNELETEVLKSKRAKVVFKRRADAEMAFSSAGKYGIFGPSLVSYCLKYMSSTPSKSSSHATKRGRKAATSDGENAT